MSGDQKIRALWKSPYLWLVVLVVFAVPLLADFNARLGYIRQMTAEAATLQEKIDQEMARQQALLSLRDYTQSNEFVEHWARQAGMARAGETVIKPSPLDSAPPMTNSTSIATPAPSDPQSEWATLFLGTR
jgi:predicted negative regulator of RcsB-dependent stress response